MDATAPSDFDLQVIPSAWAGYDAFRVAIPMETVQHAKAILAGTTYKNADIPSKPRIQDFPDYVAGRREPADNGHIWQNFVHSLPTTPSIAEAEFHPIFGRTFLHTYDDLLSGTRPDRGDIIEVALSQVVMTTWDGAASANMTVWDGAATTGYMLIYDARVVLDCTENDLGQGLCEVKVRTVQNAAALIIEDTGIDSETGQLVTQEQTHTLTATRPEGTGTDDTGYYTLVKKQEHNWYVGTRSKAVTGPTNRASALLKTKTERTPVYYPPVMIAHWQYAVLDKTAQSYYHKKFHYSMKAAYTGDVKVRYREWWQKDEPAEVEPVEIQATGIFMDREWSDAISIEKCLHPEIIVTENIIGGSVPFVAAENPSLIAQTRYIEPATPLLDWPDEVVKFDVERRAGGFQCIERTIFKPQGIISGIQILRLPLEDEIYFLSDYNDPGNH